MSEVLPPLRHPPAGRDPEPLRPALVVLGSLSAAVGFALVLAAAGLAWAHLTQRDGDGFFRSGEHRVESDGYAVTSDRIDLHADVAEAQWVLADGVGTARVVAAPVDGPLFVGIAAREDAERYLRGVEHDRVTDLSDRRLDVAYEHVPGRRAPVPPGEVDIWVASSGGRGVRTLDRDAGGGGWTVVVMAADGARGVAADVSVGVRTPLLGWVGVGFGAAGTVALALATLLLVRGMRRARGPGRPAAPAGAGDQRRTTTRVPTGAQA